MYIPILLCLRQGTREPSLVPCCKHTQVRNIIVVAQAYFPNWISRPISNIQCTIMYYTCTCTCTVVCVYPPHFLFWFLHESEHPTPGGKQVKQVVPHVRAEETYPHVAPGEGVHDVGNEGGKVETELLKVAHHTVGLTLKVVPVGGVGEEGGEREGEREEKEKLNLRYNSTFIMTSSQTFPVFSPGPFSHSGLYALYIHISLMW